MTEDNEQEQDPGWDGEPGAPKEPPPDDVVTGTVDGEERPMWNLGANGPEWVRGD